MSGDRPLRYDAGAMHDPRPAPPDDPLSPEVLLWAYGIGVFPMGEEGTDEIAWFRPDPRAVLPLDRLHVPRRLARTLRSGRFRTTRDQAFPEVMRGCAEGRPVWITERLVEAYTRLHELGHAHSLEVWQDERLAGGIYGVQLGAAFMGESMFHRVRDASKVALVRLVERLREQGFEFLEVQYLTGHLARLGAVDIPLAEYLAWLHRAARRDVRF